MRKVDYKIISDIVCEEFGFTFEQVLEQNRNQNLVLCRYLICYLCCRFKNNLTHRYTLKSLSFFIKRNHSAVIKGMRNIENVRYLKHEKELISKCSLRVYEYIFNIEKETTDNIQEIENLKKRNKKLKKFL